MSTWIAFLRGIGGGIRPLSMTDLKAALAKDGLPGVRTYIQTGNLVFASRASAPQLVRRIAACIAKNFGFDAGVFVLAPAALEKAMADNPFRKAEAVPTSLHLFFMAEPPKPDLAGMNKLKVASEEFVIRKNVLYFYAPDGFGKSKLAARVERLLGVPATARNWRTVGKVLELAKLAEHP